MKRMQKMIMMISLCVIPGALYAAGFRRSKSVVQYFKPKSYIKIPKMYTESVDPAVRQAAQVMDKQQTVARVKKVALPEKLETLQSKKYYKKDFPVLGLTYSKNLMVGTLDVFDDDVALPLSAEDAEYQQFMVEKYGAALDRAEIPQLYVSWVNSLVGHGVYSDTNMKKGDFVGECTGHILPVNRVSAKNDSLFHYPSDNPNRGFVIDTSKESNFLRFVNHNRKSNLDMEYVQHNGLWHLVFIAKQDIAKDELLTCNYGDEFWQGRRNPLQLS